jgi:hypothetical protein
VQIILYKWLSPLGSGQKLLQDGKSEKSKKKSADILSLKLKIWKRQNLCWLVIPI